MAGGTALVAGGGIGGLAAALGLARKGWRVIVLEQAAELGDIGAGIQLGPNAFHAFDYLGVGEEARAKAVFIDQLRLMDALSGAEIMHIPLDAPFRARFGNPYAVVHRGDLHGALQRACRAAKDVELRTSHAVTGYAQDGGRVRARWCAATMPSRATCWSAQTACVLLCAPSWWATASRAYRATAPTARSFPPSRCRRTCAGTRPRYGPAPRCISCTTR